MRKVVDTNFLKSAKLKEYLANPSNYVVVPDFVVMETLRGGDLESILRQLDMLTQHPQQVIVLKTTHAVCGLRKRRRRGLQRRLVDKEQTAAYAAWCEKLDRAKRGDGALRKQLVTKCEGAAADLTEIVRAQDTYAANWQNMQRNIPTRSSIFLGRMNLSHRSCSKRLKAISLTSLVLFSSASLF